MKEIIEEILGNYAFPEGVAWKRCRFGSGEVIIKKGEIGRSLFFIEEGTVRVLGEGELNENRKISPGLCDLSQGAVFGDICLYGSHVRTASIATVSDVRLVEIDSEMLSSYLDNHPTQGYLFLKALFGIMVNRLELANHRIEYLLAWGIKVHDIDKYL